jgi:hypothetical protein
MGWLGLLGDRVREFALAPGLTENRRELRRLTAIFLEKIHPERFRGEFDRLLRDATGSKQTRP